MENYREKKNHGCVSIQVTRNNTIITLTDFKGKTKLCLSAGNLGFKNSRKSTNYAAQATAEKVAHFAQKFGISSIHIQLKGWGRGKESCLRGFSKSRLIITGIEEFTPVPHNGCRPPKKRRV